MALRIKGCLLLLKWFHMIKKEKCKRDACSFLTEQVWTVVGRLHQSNSVKEAHMKTVLPNLPSQKREKGRNTMHSKAVLDQLDRSLKYLLEEVNSQVITRAQKIIPVSMF